MAQIIVRKLDQGVVECLKTMAKAKGKSLEQEAREILTAATKNSRKEFAKWAADLRAKQKLNTLSAVEIIREFRDR